MRNDIIALILMSHSIATFAQSSVVYGYDKSSREIYAENNDKKEELKFEEDYTGNPSYSFDFFSGAPSIIADGRSLHDTTTYATLKYNGEQFIIDCLYLDIKSKMNGVLVKEGFCGLNIPTPEKYSYHIDNKVDEIERDMDLIDTNLILSGRMNYLPIVIYNSKDGLLYKVYDNKQSLLADDYSILSIAKNGECKVFPHSPWVIYNYQYPNQVSIMAEKITDGRIELYTSLPQKMNVNQCLLYSAISIKPPRAYFYDSSYKVKKSYLIENDKVNLLLVSKDNKWCKVRYINNKNKPIDGNMLCSDLNISF